MTSPSGFAFSRKVALRYLWSRRSEAFITLITIISVLGVAIGVMVLNMVMAVMTGFEQELRDKIVNTNSHILVKHVGSKLYAWKEVEQQISKIAGVKSVSAFTYHQALMRTGSNNSGVLIRGLQEDSAAALQLQSFMESQQPIKELFQPRPVKSEAVDDEDVFLPPLIIGKELARSSGLLVGSTVSLLSAQVASSPFGLMPRFKRFVVAGIYSSGLLEYESGLAYTSLEQAQKFFRMQDAVSGFEVRVNDLYQAPSIAQQIVNAVGGLTRGIYAEDWTEINKPLWDALKLEKKVYFLVLLLIIVMASFSIITTLIMIVLEKRKDIAIMKTMGASTKAVAGIFCLLGTVVGALGTTLGLVAGYLGCLALQKYGFPLDERIFQMSTVPVRMEWDNFLMVGSAAFLICALATIYPAVRASRLEPSEILRYE